MEEGDDRSSLEEALRDGLITKDQYEALRERFEARHARQATSRISRRLTWTGLVLVGLFVLFYAAFFLDEAARIALTTGVLAVTAVLAAALWKDPERVHLSRGLLGLAVLEGVALLLLLRLTGDLPLGPYLVGLILTTLAGTGFGIRENSTWLASPSAAAFYVGIVPAGLPLDRTFIEAVFAVSVALAVLVALLVAAWETGRLHDLRAAYLRRRESVSQLARGHLVLFVLYTILALIVLEPFGIRGAASDAVGTVPFLLALAALLYARYTGDEKLLTVSSLLLAGVAWAFLWVTHRFLLFWPAGVLVTAAVLIYLGASLGLIRGGPPNHSSRARALTEGSRPSPRSLQRTPRAGDRAPWARAAAAAVA